MLKEELLKTFNSKKSLVIFGYLMAIAVADNVCGISQTGALGGYANAHPAFMSLLSGQSALVFYALFVWLLPVSVILLYCGRFNQESKIHMNYIYIIKTSRKKFFFSKLACSFVVSVVYFGIPLIMNLLISVLFLHGNTSFCDMEKMTASELGSEFLYYCVQHPYVGWLFYFLVAMVVFGLAGIMAQSLAIITSDMKLALCTSFAIWITMFSVRYDLTMAIQPYCEYGVEFAFKALSIYVPIVVIVSVAAYVFAVVKKDVL